ncbi:MAG: hypothetical protein NZZ41_06015 [Candidatus Dojkabacteria bacterium]|nr:hypothetical protein [Candidatus Dojkabacteria bacterium]
MPLEYNVAYNQLIFNIEIPTTRTKVIDLLSNDQKLEFNKKIILDGYIYSPQQFFISHKINGDEEPFEENSYAFFPIVNWPEKVWIRASSNTIGRIKLLIDFTSKESKEI